MNMVFRILGTIVFLSLAACSTMNSDFSCNATAGDSCLTIEEVDNMTRFADGADFQYRPRKVIQKTRIIRKPSRPYLSEKSDDEPVWIAPWKDKGGRQHEAQTLFAGKTLHNARA